MRLIENEILKAKKICKNITICFMVGIYFSISFIRFFFFEKQWKLHFLYFFLFSVRSQRVLHHKKNIFFSFAAAYLFINEHSHKCVTSQNCGIKKTKASDAFVQSWQRRRNCCFLLSFTCSLLQDILRASSVGAYCLVLSLFFLFLISVCCCVFGYTSCFR